MNARTILFRILVCATIVLMWAWMSADEWEQELKNEQMEQERVQSIQAYNKSKQSSALSEDYVDTTPVAIPEAEPTYISAPVKRAKKSVVTAKRQIKRRVNKN
jgi:hypothetical protein